RAEQPHVSLQSRKQDTDNRVSHRWFPFSHRRPRGDGPGGGGPGGGAGPSDGPLPGGHGFGPSSSQNVAHSLHCRLVSQPTPAPQAPAAAGPKNLPTPRHIPT